MGALGIGLIIFVDSAWVAGVSVVLWGLGASLGFPLTISAASDTGPDAPTRVSVVATTGYLAFRRQRHYSSRRLAFGNGTVAGNCRSWR